MIFTMRNSIFGFAMVQKQGISHRKRFKCLIESREHEGDGFFYHDKREFLICNGKKCKRSYFLAMRNVVLRVFMVNYAQGVCVHIFVIPEGCVFSRVKITSQIRLGVRSLPSVLVVLGGSLTKRCDMQKIARRHLRAGFVLCTAPTLRRRRSDVDAFT